MRTATLRIKKKYYDAIKKGIKKEEYRADSPYYQNLFKNKVDIIKLHYQSGEHLLVKVKGIKKIKAPRWLIAAGMLEKIHLTEHIFRIRLAEILT